MGPFYSDATDDLALRHGQSPSAINVYAMPPDRPGIKRPVGVAELSWSIPGWPTIWRLKVDRVELPWRFVLIGGAFWPVR